MLKPILATGLTIFVLAYLLPTVSYSSIPALVVASIVLTILQKIIKPILNLLFLPINIVTLGFFSLVINVTLLWVATYLVPGFNIQAMTIFGTHLNQFFSLLVVSAFIGLLQSLIGFVL